MKKIKQAFITILITIGLFFSVGCSKIVDYTVDISAMTGDYNLLVERYDTLRYIVAQKWETIDKEDQNKLKFIDDNVKRIIFTVGQLKSKQFYELTPSEIGYLKKLGEDSYVLAKEIYIKYHDQLTSTELITIQIFDERVTDLNDAIDEFINDPEKSDINEMLLSILVVASTGLKLIVPLFI